MSVRRLFYANGGGLGHLTRTSAFISMKNFLSKDCIILTASAKAFLFFETFQIEIIPSQLAENKELLVLFIQEKIIFHQINEFYIDTFPLGIFGELQWMDFKNIQVFYLARLLKWEVYKPIFEKIPFYFKESYIFENLEQNHFLFVKQYSINLKHLTICYPNVNIGHEMSFLEDYSVEKWLVVHSEPKEEVEILMKYASDLAISQDKIPLFFIITQASIASNLSFHKLDIFPAYSVFPYFDKIITACGFNLMNQAKFFKNKHIAIPFERKYDNQFARRKFFT